MIKRNDAHELPTRWRPFDGHSFGVAAFTCGVVAFDADSDAVLLAGTRADPDAFAAFYRRYERLILGYLLRRTRDPEIAADLTAEVFASALRAAGRYQPESATAVGWLLTIAERTLSSSLRRGRVEARARRRLGIRDAVLFTGEDLERIETLASLDGQSLALLDSLPGHQREAVRARILDERSYREIAGELQTSELVIRKRVSRGLSTLKRQLEEPT
jgi:RNA polymerase sigma factor (sigma-70 family)